MYLRTRLSRPLGLVDHERGARHPRARGPCSGVIASGGAADDGGRWIRGDVGAAQVVRAGSEVTVGAIAMAHRVAIGAGADRVVLVVQLDVRVGLVRLVVVLLDRHQLVVRRPLLRRALRLLEELRTGLGEMLMNGKRRICRGSPPRALHHRLVRRVRRSRRFGEGYRGCGHP
jgi:hypothetical protein